MFPLARDSYRFDHLLMTITARCFGHLAIAFGYLDRFVKGVRSEIVGVPKPVGSLGVILAEKVVRRMAIVTCCDSLMARFGPAVILLVHHVAIGARLRVIAEIRSTFRVPESINTNACGKADTDAENGQFG